MSWFFQQGESGLPGKPGDRGVRVGSASLTNFVFMFLFQVKSKEKSVNIWFVLNPSGSARSTRTTRRERRLRRTRRGGKKCEARINDSSDIVILSLIFHDIWVKFKRRTSAAHHLYWSPSQGGPGPAGARGEKGEMVFTPPCIFSKCPSKLKLLSKLKFVTFFALFL